MFTVFFPDESFALFVSGGFDSAVMLHLYCLEAKKRNRTTLHCITADRGFAAIEFSQGVCDWAKQKHGVEINHIVVPTPEGMHNSREVAHAAEKVYHYGFKTLICAETKNPPVELPGTAPTRVPQTLNIPGWHFPFSHLDKKDTIQLAFDLGILDEIAPISHTCTTTTGIRCGFCWNCHERKWAFDELGLEDSGNY